MITNVSDIKYVKMFIFKRLLNINLFMIKQLLNMNIISRNRLRLELYPEAGRVSVTPGAPLSTRSVMIVGGPQSM